MRIQTVKLFAVLGILGFFPFGAWAMARQGGKILKKFTVKNSVNAKSYSAAFLRPDNNQTAKNYPGPPNLEAAQANPLPVFAVPAQAANFTEAKTGTGPSSNSAPLLSLGTAHE